jgi:hypothetical protein
MNAKKNAHQEIAEPEIWVLSALTGPVLPIETLPDTW